MKTCLFLGVFLFDCVDTKQPSIATALAKTKAKANPVMVDSSDEDKDDGVKKSSAAPRTGGWSGLFQRFKYAGVSKFFCLIATLHFEMLKK